MKIPFNKPYLTGKELDYIQEATNNGGLGAGGHFTQECESWLENTIGCSRSLMTHSCTAALEMCALLADIKPGDEIIIPSFTFVTTATAFVLKGGVPVFVDIREDTLNIDETKIEEAITPKTKAIVVIHYSGIGSNMEVILDLANKHNIIVIEDAAHSLMAQYNGKPLGNYGHLATVSFHETKNISAGEGGALLINDKEFLKRAEIIADKGTDRTQFLKGEIDKYSWIDIGSSYRPSELTSAFLFAQLEEARSITKKRCAIWDRYQTAFKKFEGKNGLHFPVIPSGSKHNAHTYFILAPDLKTRNSLIKRLAEKNIQATFHYIPLHLSDYGKQYVRGNSLKVTEDVSERILRLPLWVGVEDHLDYIIETVTEELEKL